MLSRMIHPAPIAAAAFAFFANPAAVETSKRALAAGPSALPLPPVRSNAFPLPRPRPAEAIHASRHKALAELPLPRSRPAGDLITAPDPDVRLVAQALRAAKNERWKRLKVYESKAKDALSRKLIRWLRFSKPGGDASIAELQRFLKSNSGWPGRGAVRAKLERALARRGKDADVIAWFDADPPATAVGEIRLGEAFSRKGRRTDARRLFRKAWITGNLPRADEKRFLRLHRKHLTRDDHIARLDRLLWEGRSGAAKRTMWKLPKAYQKLAQARLALRRQRGNVDALINQVPQQFKDDPGLIYERVRWRRRKGKESAISLLRNQPAASPHAKRWWIERRFLARKALQKGYITDAYRIAKNHGLTEGAGFAEGEWMSGWIALRFLNEPATALPHFQLMYQRVRYPVSRSRGAYWVGRAYSALGMVDKASEWHRRAASHPTTYYGQLAAGLLGADFTPEIPAPPIPSPETQAAFERHELALASRMLAKAGAGRELSGFLHRLSREKAGDPVWQALTAKLAHHLERPELAIRGAKRAERSGVVMLDAGYPRRKPPLLRAKWNLTAPENALTLAVIRQESAFQENAVSHAGARGLMQIIPPTAKRISKRLGLRYSKRKLTESPAYNMTLGQAYLSGLIRDFGGSYVMALAAYNAGPARVRKWVRENGDPRTKNVDAIDWIEMIPFTETRNYVQRVMENLQVYRLRLNTTEVAMAPEKDLNR